MSKWAVALLGVVAGLWCAQDCLAQTACPQGVAAGSYGCGPDPSGGGAETRVYYDALGAASFSEERFKVYPVTQHGGDVPGVEARAMQKCLEDGAPSDCRVLQWWVNGCASLYTGYAGDQVGMFWGFDAGYRARISKRQAQERCEASGAQNCSVFKLGRHTDAICVKRGYRSQ
jgi:hypothetical protein